MADLLIRAAMNDHVVLSDLLAPSIRPLPAGRRPLISHLVADAHVAALRPGLADTARAAGIPYLIDPDTTFLQSEVAATDKWVQLPYATAAALTPSDIQPAMLAEQAVEFQLESGATFVIPPYFYAASPSDPWFQTSLTMIDATAAYMRGSNIRLPLLPIFCGRLQSFGDPGLWSVGVDRFGIVARESAAKSIALCLSPTGAGDDGYGKLSRLFATAMHARESSLEVFAWRQGIYGLGLVAAGLDGYESGMGTGEQTQMSRRQSARKPKADSDSSGGGGPGIYLETLGRSVPRSAGQTLLADHRTRAKVMCDDEGCCPTVSATLDNSRHHAVRARARQLAEIEQQPHASWRLHHVARQAEGAVTLGAQANAVLKQEGITIEIKTKNMASLARVASELAALQANPRSA
jgi:hypothetical protein